MTREELETEIASRKTKLIISSVLCGVFLIASVVLAIVFEFGFVMNAMELSGIYDFESVIPDEEIANMLYSYIGCFVLIVLFSIGSEVCVPFIIINAVKLGNRKKALKKLNNGYEAF